MIADVINGSVYTTSRHFECMQQLLKFNTASVLKQMEKLRLKEKGHAVLCFMQNHNRYNEHCVEIPDLGVVALILSTCSYLLCVFHFRLLKNL